ncbi:MAG: hypothetical protein MTP17_00360 [Candidatus Midichloria sp.]|nr:MAG: hypothetical protein MTP17_00360 [Candidatus Midichloria sp.]
MPYKDNFDYPVFEELQCKSLYEVNQMADQGAFDPNNNAKQKRCEVNILGMTNESKNP